MTFKGTGATAIALLVVLAVAFPARAQSGTVEGIEIQGLVQMTHEAFSHQLGIKVGDSYDPIKIRVRYKKLWELGVFEDLGINAEDGPNGGKVLIIKVKERKTLTSISYEDNKVLTRTAIEDRLKERKIKLETGKPLNLKAIADTEGAIRDLLGEKGYLDAVVSHRLDTPTEATAAVYFSIRPGAKTRIRKITFVGNKVFKSRTLKKQLKLTAEYKWYWPWSSKNLYHPAKWDQDSGGIRNLYQNGGYLDVEISPPVVDLREIQSGKTAKKGKAATPAAGTGEVPATEAPAPPPPPPPPPKAPSEPPEGLSPDQVRKWYERQRAEDEKARKKAEKERKKAEPTVRRWAYITVRIGEGPRYRLGNVAVAGNTVFTEQQVRARVPLREKNIVNAGLLDLAIQRIQRDYQDRGYAYATARREIERRPGDEKIADVKLVINEDKQYYVSRIEFSGNTSTQDKVLRREFRLNEGDLFNRSLLDLSVAKVNQLGYFEAKRDDVVVEPVSAENNVHITVPGEEKGRNEINVGGGYSGVDGAFFQGFYSTRNFLGRGMILTASVQVGGRANRYQLQLQEPWFLGSPYTLGFSLFRQELQYSSTLKSQSNGFGVILGRVIGNYTNVQFRYDWQDVTSTGYVAGSPSAQSRISSFTPSYVYNTVDNPYRPRTGWSAGADVAITGGPLGGDVSYIRPILSFSKYKPVARKQGIALHSQIGQILEWAGGSAPSSAIVNGVPQYQRFWLGGEMFGPRIFETRTISPVRYVSVDRTGTIVATTNNPVGTPSNTWYDANGDGFIDSRDRIPLGGDRFALAQFEYVFTLSNPVELAFFVDVGESLFEDTSWRSNEVRVAAGAELRFYLPVFPVPLRLIYGVPIRKLPEDRTSAFTFSIGRSF